MSIKTDNKENIFIYILIGVIVFGFIQFNKNNKKIERLTDLISEYQYALNQANENIEEANSIIEDAQNYAWSSYQEMGEALDNLYIVDTVFEP